MKLLEGLSEEVLHDVAINLPITKGARRLIDTLKSYGFKTAILSGGFTYFGHYLQKELDIDYVYANELEIKDGILPDPSAVDPVTGEPLPGEGEEMGMMGDVPQEPDLEMDAASVEADAKAAEI